MKKLLFAWLFVWFIFTMVSTKAEELNNAQITTLPQLMDCGSIKTIGKRLSALGQYPFLQSDASLQVPIGPNNDPKIVFGEVMIFMNENNYSYSMVFKLPNAMRAKGNIDLCVFNVGRKLRPASVKPQVETLY